MPSSWLLSTTQTAGSWYSTAVARTPLTMLNAPSPVSTTAGLDGSAATAPSTPDDAQPISAMPELMYQASGLSTLRYGSAYWIVSPTSTRIRPLASATASPVSYTRRAGWIGLVGVVMTSRTFSVQVRFQPATSASHGPCGRTPDAPSAAARSVRKTPASATAPTSAG